MKEVLILIIELILISLVSAGARINEVMADPSTCPDADCEYIEIYTDNPINLTNWKINTGTNNLSFNFYLEDYLIITKDKTIFLANFPVNENKVIVLGGISLHNTEQDSIFLFDNNFELISNFTYTETHPGISWQYCSGNWLERNPTPGVLNNCTIPQNNTPGPNNTSNPPQNNTNNTNTQETSISLSMDWNEDEIINGDEFEIEVGAENLKNEKYNVKVWIEFEDEDTIISDRYGEDSGGEEVWKSGNYYIYNLFDGPGDKTEAVNLRIRGDYKDFSGDAKIFFKLSTGEEISKNIEILEKKEEKTTEKQRDVKNNSEKTKITTKPNKPTNSITGEVIKLGSSESKETIEKIGNSQNTNLIYESKNEKIKIYALMGFALLCLVIIILLAFKNPSGFLSHKN